MIKFIPYILYLLLVAMYQVFLKDITSIYGVTINLPILLVLGVAFYKSEVVACWFGFFVGLVVSAEVPQLVGWNMLIFAIIAFMAFHVVIRLNIESLYARLLFILSGVLLYNIIILLLYRSDSIIYSFFTKSLISAIYTTIIAWLFFLFKDRRITLQKIKSIF